VTPESMYGKPVRGGDVVRLKHITSRRFLRVDRAVSTAVQCKARQERANRCNGLVGGGGGGKR
jgi:hypothetical protein